MKKQKFIKAPCHEAMKTTTKLNESGFILLPQPSYTPDLAPTEYWLFVDLKKMLQSKIFDTNVEVTAPTEAYFDYKNKSCY